jgi:hypothetical protein
MKKKKCKGARKHCWHWDGTVTDSGGDHVQYDLICCFCGATWFTPSLTNLENHGKYRPPTYRLEYYEKQTNYN